MAIQTLTHVAWQRFHDPRNTPIRPDVNQVHCADDPKDFIALCKQRQATGLKLRAAGSHWSLSEGTLSDDVAVETNWPGTQNVPRNTGFAIDLGDLISKDLFRFMEDNPPIPSDKGTEDPCLRDGPFNAFFVHLKSGTRVYEAYTLLDFKGTPQTRLAQNLNGKLSGGPNANAYDGPWAITTMGGAGGQTVFGALTTGTHGGDFRQRPISDSVVAMHLVCDGGDHYWIEPAHGRMEFPIADDDKLLAVYGGIDPTVRFSIIRDDDVFDSVVVGAGRFGIVISMVVRVVPQFCLLQHRHLDDWSHVKLLLQSPARHHSFDFAFFAGANSASDQTEFDARFSALAKSQNRFLQIAVNLPPHQNDEHRCGVTQRWYHPNSAPEARDPGGEIRGRNERGTPATAGLTAPCEAPDNTAKTGSSNGTFLTKACADGNFIAGLARQLAVEIEQIIADNAVTAGGIVAGAIAVGAGAAVLAIATICAVLAAIVIALIAVADAIDAMGDASLAETVDAAIKAIEAVPGIPDSVKILAIRTILLQAFEAQQSNSDYVAISYVVMDGHDYLDRSCFGNAESIEIFFDASRPDRYCAFVDAVLAFEAAQEEQSFRFSVGYVSLRFIRGSRGLIAPAQFDDTVAIEISGIRAASGSIPFIMNAVALARNPMFGGVFHWGQFNPLTRPEVEQLYDVAPEFRLSRWRNSLRLLTQNGAFDGFSSDFTRRSGLEL